MKLEQDQAIEKQQEKQDEFKNAIAKLKKQHQQELAQAMNEAQKARKELEQEVLVLKEMVKSVNMQLKSKDIDI